MKNLISILGLAFVLSLSQATIAQPSTSTSDGKYEGTFAGEYRGRAYTKPVTMVLQGSSGIWKIAPSLTGNNCLNSPVQFVFDATNTNELNFVTEYSKQLAGCGDLKVSLKKTGDDELKGSIDANGKLLPVEFKRVKD